MNRIRPGYLVLLLAFVIGTGRSAADDRPTPPAKYEAAVRALDRFIAHEVEAKRLPALSIALVDDQAIVWARGYGFANPVGKVRATSDTVYRVGSVSKLFTDIAVMRLVEQGRLDLDAPIDRYLTDFKPRNPFRKPITLRQLMAHRSGLVREPPVGNYFDPTHPSLAETIASLNRTELVYPPEERIKYSNAAIAAVGYVLETTQKEPFVRYLKRTLLDPLAMTRSSFEATPGLNRDLAVATMWTYHGREFEAPTFALGIAPAGNMYSTVTDLGHFLSVLFARGRTASRPILQPETLEQMWTPHFAKPGEKTGFGLGFRLEELDGHRRIGHGGAIYGFATELAGLPDDKLGVVVIAARDVANSVTQHIAEEALKQMLAVRQGKTLPPIEETRAVEPARARRLAGHYACDEKTFELTEHGGRLWVLPGRGGFRPELRALGEDLITDDVLDYGTRIQVEGDKLRVGKDAFERTPVGKPPAVPARWEGLIGEYGWDHDILYILEKDGRLYALIEWFFYYPLQEVSADVFRFPDYGLYLGEQLVFHRDARGRPRRSSRPACHSSGGPSTGRTAPPFASSRYGRSRSCAAKPWPTNRRRRAGSSASRTWWM
jgi:CubicO group peptidase (beta-lactamase class C family)